MIIVEKDPRGVTTITLNRPEKRNAMNRVMLEQLHAALSDSKVLVLRANGPIFCSGMDLKESNLWELLESVLKKLTEFPGITIAAVQGGALAGGIALLAACDLVIAEEGIFLTCPEVRLGIVPSYLATLLARKMAPWEMLLLAEPFPVERATGLVQRVVKTLQPEIELVVQAALKADSEAVRRTKQLLQELYPLDLTRARGYH